MDGDGSYLRNRYTIEPSVWALVWGLVSARWLLIVGCCLAAHWLPPPAYGAGAAGAGGRAGAGDAYSAYIRDGPDAASALFVLAVASALADLRLYPAFYRPPSRALLLFYDVVVSLVATSWAEAAAWTPLRMRVREGAEALQRHCERLAREGSAGRWSSLAPGAGTGDALWATACALPLPADAARLAALLLALGACAAVVHATELIPRLMDYYDDWRQARKIYSLERRRRVTLRRTPLHGSSADPPGFPLSPTLTPPRRF